jgi:hypothetical protein
VVLPFEDLFRSNVMISFSRGDNGVVLDRKTRAAEVEKAHRNTILKNVERRLQIARSRGDETLVKLLEAEQKQFS